MGADSKDQSAGSIHGDFFVDNSSNATQSNHPFSCEGNGYTPKVRKPYTITKQRERWSEAEHLRFVEALKLYGRSWRQIEEHVATKTAIQIRSHAQKFFAKVTRDSGCCRGEWSLNPDDIPPPRPKKKPMHPYPRKRSAANEVENVSSMDGDNNNKYSPSSVLSPLASDNLDMDKNSPNSPNTTEDFFALSFRKPSPDDKFAMKLELFPEESESTMDSPCTAAAAVGSIKLFGKTLTVTSDEFFSPYSSNDNDVWCGWYLQNANVNYFAIRRNGEMPPLLDSSSYHQAAANVCS